MDFKWYGSEDRTSSFVIPTDELPLCRCMARVTSHHFYSAKSVKILG